MQYDCLNQYGTLSTAYTLIPPSAPLPKLYATEMLMLLISMLSYIVQYMFAEYFKNFYVLLLGILLLKLNFFYLCLNYWRWNTHLFEYDDYVLYIRVFSSLNKKTVLMRLSHFLFYVVNRDATILILKHYFRPVKPDMFLSGLVQVQ